MSVEFLSDNTQYYSKSTIDIIAQKQELEEQAQLPVPEVVVCPECFTPDSSVTCAGYGAGLKGYKRFKFVCHEYHFKPYKCACCGNVFVQTKHQKTNNIAHPILWWIAGISIIASLVLVGYSIYAASLIGFLALPVFLIGAMVNNICKNIDYGFTKSDKITEDILFQEMSNLFNHEFEDFDEFISSTERYLEKRSIYVGKEQAMLDAESVEDVGESEDTEPEPSGVTYSYPSNDHVPKKLAKRQGGKVRQTGLPLHSVRLVADAGIFIPEAHEPVSESSIMVVQEPDGDMFAYDSQRGTVITLKKY